MQFFSATKACPSNNIIVTSQKPNNLSRLLNVSVLRVLPIRIICYCCSLATS